MMPTLVVAFFKDPRFLASPSLPRSLLIYVESMAYVLVAQFSPSSTHRRDGHYDRQILDFIESEVDNVSYIVFIQQYERVLCIYALLWVVFGGHLCGRTCKGEESYHYERLMRLVSGLFAGVYHTFVNLTLYSMGV